MAATNVDSIYKIINHPVFLSAFFSWFVAQTIKSIIELFKTRNRSTRRVFRTMFWATGGMPSSHSSIVAALATAVGFIEGVRSPLFITLLFYGLLTVRDALGVRRATGMQARVMNQLGKEIQDKLGINFKPVKEIHGHTFAEVSVGILLGFFIAVAFSSL